MFPKNVYVNNIYEYKRRGSVGYFVCPSLKGLVLHGFSTKLPLVRGSSPTEGIFFQKQRLCDALQIDAHSVLTLQQVHGDKICVVSQPLAHMTPGEYDGAVTNIPHVVLSILTADCLPILLYEKEKRIIGAVHAGWRGTSLGILQNALTSIEQNFGGCTKDCLVLLGPSLRPCCFEIKEDVLKILQGRLSFWQKVIRVIGGRTYFDLQRANRIQAWNMGVPQENIWALHLCTYCQPGWFHSYRRDKERAERMISIISLP